MNTDITSFYNDIELSMLGFKSYGDNVLISRNAKFYGIVNMSIGSNVRIDDFCILSGRIELGSHIHISAFCALYGANGIKMGDYTGLSPRCTVFSASDDFSGDFLISPMADMSKTNVTGGEVIFKSYSQIGSGSVILPNLTIGEGVVVGAMSLVKNSLIEWGVYAGVPVKRIKERGKDLLKLV